MNILQEYGLQDAGDREVGIEIELEGQNLLPDRPIQYWDIKGDGSLRGIAPGEAVEYALKKPVLREAVPKRLKYLKSKLTDLRAVPQFSERAGVHVHINCQRLTSQEVVRFACMYYVLENLLVNWCGQTRVGNLFCLRLGDAEDTAHNLVHAKKMGNLHNLLGDGHRYGSLNFGAIRRFGSLEFRALRSDPDIVEPTYTWVKMLLTVKDAALAYKRTHEILDDLSFRGVPGFLENNLGEYADLLKCPDMEDMVMEGARLIQDVAYIPWSAMRNPDDVQGLEEGYEEGAEDEGGDALQAAQELRARIHWEPPRDARGPGRRR